MLAFAIDAWWEERELRIEEQQVLEGLREEFISIHEVLSQHLNEHLQVLGWLEKFLVTAETSSAEEAGPIVDAVLLGLLRPRTSNLGNGTLNALLNSGRIEILTNRLLRAQLAAWEGVIGEVWDDQASLAKMVYEIHIPYFANEKIPAGATMHQLYDEWPLPPRLPSDNSVMVTRLLNDETLRTLVEIRYAYMRHTTQEFETAVAAADAILAELESSIH